MDPEHKSASPAPLLLRFTIAAVAGFVLVALLLLSLRDNSRGTVNGDVAEQERHTSATASTAGVPELTQPVNDFANVIGSGRHDIERAITTLFSETADVIVVATVQSIAPFSDIRDYSVEMFNRSGIGASGKDNGILVLLAVDNRQVRITTGFGMETMITDAVATQIARRMTDYFRRGEIDAGLLAGVEDLANRIRTVRNAETRNSS